MTNHWPDHCHLYHLCLQAVFGGLCKAVFHISLTPWTMFLEGSKLQKCSHSFWFNQSGARNHKQCCVSVIFSPRGALCTALQKCGRRLCTSHYERLVNTNDLYILAWHCHSKWMVQWLILMIDCLVDLKVEWQKQKRRVAEMYFSPVYIADNKWKHNVIWNVENVVHQTFLTIIELKWHKMLKLWLGIGGC